MFALMCQGHRRLAESRSACGSPECSHRVRGFSRMKTRALRGCRLLASGPPWHSVRFQVLVLLALLSRQTSDPCLSLPVCVAAVQTAKVGSGLCSLVASRAYLSAR